MGEGHDLAAITLRRALGYELLKSLDLRDEALCRSLLVVLSMNHCAKGGQAIGDLNTCGTGCCLSTESTAQQLQMVYAEGGFGADVKVVVIAFNGTPVCERDAESSCGCAVPKRGEQTAAMRRFMEFQQALVDAFLGPDVPTAVMSAYAGHADPDTTGLAMAVPTGSVTLSETGAGAVEVTVGLWHPAGLQRKVAVAMGAGGDEQREVDRALAKQRVVDHLAALRRWAAALAVLRDRRLKGSATAPCPWLLAAAVAVAVPPTEVTSQELRALWINPAEASGEGGPSHACAHRSGRKHERRALQVSAASIANKCTRRIAATRVSADIKPDVKTQCVCVGVCGCVCLCVRVCCAVCIVLCCAMCVLC